MLKEVSLGTGVSQEDMVADHGAGRRSLVEEQEETGEELVVDAEDGMGEGEDVGG